MFIFHFTTHIIYKIVMVEVNYDRKRQKDNITTRFTNKDVRFFYENIYPKEKEK